jgi:murein DD-endopeptidase MepM/ murein hydrolase activator NlpD
VYTLVAEGGTWQMSLELDAADRIASLLITDGGKAPPPVAGNAQPIALPFTGRWHVFWGGSTPEDNRGHLDHASQRRAADLLRMEGGQSHRGRGDNNQDYFAYGQEILAVADGMVTTVVDGIDDNPPGQMNRYFAPGNMVIIQHSPTLYSVYAHLQPGTMRVKKGERIKRGQVLAACGNSGNSSEPHLHFQLQDGPRFESSFGVEPGFANVRVDRAGALSAPTLYHLRKGDEIEPR